MTKIIITEAQTKILISELFSQKLVDNLIQRFQQETPTDEKTLRFYIDRFQQIKDSPKVQKKDITTYSWIELQQVVDMNQSKIPGEDKIIIDNSNIIHEDQYTKIILANSRKACVHYGNGYTFCISARSNDNAFNDYRFSSENYTTYFFENKTKSKEQISLGKFKDPNHLIVVMVGEGYEDDNHYDPRYSGQNPDYQDEDENLKQYVKITNANNDREHDFESWEDTFEEYPELEDYQHFFQQHPPNEMEEKIYKMEKIYKGKLNFIERKYDHLFYTKKPPSAKLEPVKWITKINSLDPSSIKKIDKLLQHDGVYTYTIVVNNSVNYHKSFSKLTEEQIKKLYPDSKISQFGEQYHPFTDEYKEYLNQAKQIVLDFLHEKNKLNIN